MKNKIKKEFTRDELADYLQNLADQLRSGRFNAGDREWSVPSQLIAQIKHKEKKGRIKTKLKWRWSTLEDYNSEERREVVQWQDSFKTIKKRLSANFKALNKAVNGGSWPDEKTLKAFIDDSNAMAAFTEPEWQEAMDNYMDHLKNLRHAVENNQLEVVEHELRDLTAGMKACHRDYK